MNNFKKSLVLFFICIVFWSPQKAFASKATDIVDKTINFTANSVYIVTKYTLKSVYFVAKETVKGTVKITKSIFNGTKDAFISAPKVKPAYINKKQDSIKADNDKKEALAKEEIIYQHKIRNILMVGLILLVGFAVLLYRSLNTMTILFF